MSYVAVGAGPRIAGRVAVPTRGAARPAAARPAAAAPRLVAVPIRTTSKVGSGGSTSKGGGGMFSAFQKAADEAKKQFTKVAKASERDLYLATKGKGSITVETQNQSRERAKREREAKHREECKTAKGDTVSWCLKQGYSVGSAPAPKSTAPTAAERMRARQPAAALTPAPITPTQDQAIVDTIAETSAPPGVAAAVSPAAPAYAPSAPPEGGGYSGASYSGGGGGGGWSWPDPAIPQEDRADLPDLPDLPKAKQAGLAGVPTWMLAVGAAGLGYYFLTKKKKGRR